MEKQQKGEKEVGNAMNTIEKKLKSCHIEKLDFKTVIDWKLKLEKNPTKGSFLLSFLLFREKLRSNRKCLLAWNVFEALESRWFCPKREKTVCRVQAYPYTLLRISRILPYLFTHHIFYERKGCLEIRITWKSNQSFSNFKLRGGIWETRYPRNKYGKGCFWCWHQNWREPVSHFLDVVLLSRFSCQWTNRVK